MARGTAKRAGALARRAFTAATLFRTIEEALSGSGAPVPG
jgi:hypothetical protein